MTWLHWSVKSSATSQPVPGRSDEPQGKGSCFPPSIVSTPGGPEVRIGPRREENR